MLTLVVDPVERIHFDHAAWAGALLVLAPEAPNAPEPRRGRAAAGEAAATRSGAVPLVEGPPRRVAPAHRPRAARRARHSLASSVAAAQVPGAQTRGHRDDAVPPRRDSPGRAGSRASPSASWRWTSAAQAHRFDVVRRDPGRRTCAAGDAGASVSAPMPKSPWTSS